MYICVCKYAHNVQGAEEPSTSIQHLMALEDQIMARYPVPRPSPLCIMTLNLPSMCLARLELLCAPATSKLHACMHMRSQTQRSSTAAAETGTGQLAGSEAGSTLVAYRSRRACSHTRGEAGERSCVTTG